MTPPDLAALAREWFANPNMEAHDGDEDIDSLTALLESVATLSRTAGRDELETQLWLVIDRDGRGDVPSDIVGAVARLVELAKSERTAGRAEGLAEAANIARDIARQYREGAKPGEHSEEFCATAALASNTVARAIRALASDPAPGEQVAEGATIRQMLLLSSYCGGENAGCTDEKPCADCLAMCNVFEVPALGKYLREFGAPAHPAEPGEWTADPAQQRDHWRRVAERRGREIARLADDVERLRAIETAAREYRRLVWKTPTVEIQRARSEAGFALDDALSTPQPKGEPIRHGSLCPFAISNGAPPFKCNCDYDLRVAIAQPKGETP